MDKRLAISLVALMVFAAAPSVAGTEQRTGRYVLKQTTDGFMRLDTETGSLAHCRKIDGQWQCKGLAAGNADQDPDIASLKRQNLELGKRVARLEHRIETLTVKNAGPRPRLQLPSDRELDEVMGFFEKLMSRLMQFARTWQDPPGKDI